MLGNLLACFSAAFFEFTTRVLIFENRSRHRQRLGIPVAAGVVIIRLQLFPSPVNAGLDLDELRIFNFLAIFKVQLAGEDLIWFVRIEKRHAELMAHQRPEFVNGANAIF